MVRLWLIISLSLTAVIPAVAVDWSTDLAPFSKLVTDKKTDGLIVAISFEGKDYYFAFGTTSRQTKAIPTSETIWEIGSLTKSVTGLLLSDLVLQGKLSPEASVSSLLPIALRNQKVGAITLDQLATHTSGLPRMPANFKDTADLNPYGHYDTLDMYRFLSEVEPKAQKFEYSNLGVGLLGHLLAKTTKVSYEALATEKVLKPLGMNSSSFYPLVSQLSQVAQGYHDKIAVPIWKFDVLVGIGGLKASADDMLKYLKAQAGLVETPLRAAMDFSQKERAAVVPGVKSGYGWIVREQSGKPKMVWHNGGTHGFVSFAAFVPGKAAIFVAANSNEAREIDGIAMQLLERLTFQKNL